MKRAMIFVGILLLPGCGEGVDTSVSANEAGADNKAMPSEAYYNEAIRGKDTNEQLLGEIQRLSKECTGEEDRDCFFLARAEAAAMERGLIKRQPLVGSEEEPDPKDLLSSDFRECIKGLARVETLQCVEQELNRQDALLNSNYQEVLGELSSEKREALRAEQRQWIRNRDQRCEVESGEGFGPVALNLIECHMIETARRRWTLLDLSFEARNGG